MTATIDPKKCTGCGQCLDSCPLDSISLCENQDESGPKACIDDEICGECGACIDVCPNEAISL